MDKDIGVITVLMERFEKQRLPRLLSLKEKVNSGEMLNEMDLDFLDKAMSDARKGLSLADTHPDFQQLASKMVGLYNEITEKDLQLEKDSK